MKGLFFIITLLLSFIASAQFSNDLIIDGHITGMYSRNRNKGYIVNASVHLITGSGDQLVVDSDTNGYYYFRFSAFSFKTATITVSTSRSIHKSNEKCSCYLASRDVSILNNIDSGKPRHFIKDFELLPVEDCCGPYFPGMKFKHQSLVYDTVFTAAYYNKSDSLLDIPANGLFQLSKTLKDNPTIIIQIDGHCSFNEKLPDELSQLRAEKVKLDIIKSGVEEKRIICKGHGASRLLVKPEIIKKTKSIEEKAALHSKNRRCVFHIVSWDYVQEQKTTNRQTINNKQQTTNTIIL